MKGNIIVLFKGKPLNKKKKNVNQNTKHNSKAKTLFLAVF